MRRQYKIICSVYCLVLAMFHFFQPKNLVNVIEANNTEITAQDIIKMSEALNMSTDSEVYDIGTNPYRIFDVNNKEFESLFISSNITDSKNYSFSGNSRADISSKYSKERAYGMNAEISGVPIFEVSANIDANFQTNISSSLEMINEEYYEYFERYQQTRVITTNWLSNDLTEYFSKSFINDLQSVTSIETAVNFLEKYGTHVFNQYYLGGSLIITNYIVSEVSISEAYESESKSIGLSAHISEAVATNAKGTNSELEGKNVSNEQTNSQMRMRAHGGMNFNAMTVNDLFTYKQEYFTGGGSGYIYADWIKSLDSNQNEVVINVAKPVAIWSLLDKSSYYDATRKDYFEQAFDIMCYSNYSKLCSANGIDSEIIGNIEYESNGAQVEVNITNNTIKLPSNITAKVEFGNLLKNNEDISNIKIKLKENYQYAFINNNQIYIDSSASGKSIVLMVTLYGEDIYTLNITIDDNKSSYANGYGTKDQPYLISTVEQWNTFINSNDSYNQKNYYKLINDIDLKGKSFEVGGSSAREAFKGVLDGAGNMLSNFSIIAKSEWQNIGLFGINRGTIENLRLNNIRVMNSEIISADNSEINVGVLVGENHGKIGNVTIDDCSIRVTAQLENSQMNAGVLCGISRGGISGDVSFIGITNCNIYGQTWKGNGVINVGGMVGQVKLSNITNGYVQNTKINAYNIESKKSSYALGGLVGLVTSNKDTVSTISYCLTYANSFNTQNGTFGYMAGKSTANNSFANCYFESSNNRAVNNSSMNGCKALRKISLKNIGDAKFNTDWTTDEQGNVILKKHI